MSDKERFGNETENKVIRMYTQIEAIFKSIDRIDKNFDDINKKVVTTTMLEDMQNNNINRLKSLESRINDRIKPLEKVVYGLITLILTSVFVALLALVVRN